MNPGNWHLLASLSDFSFILSCRCPSPNLVLSNIFSPSAPSRPLPLFCSFQSRSGGAISRRTGYPPYRLRNCQNGGCQLVAQEFRFKGKQLSSNWWSPEIVFLMSFWYRPITGRVFMSACDLPPSLSLSCFVSLYLALSLSVSVSLFLHLCLSVCLSVCLSLTSLSLCSWLSFWGCPCPCPRSSSLFPPSELLMHGEQ